MFEIEKKIKPLIGIAKEEFAKYNETISKFKFKEVDTNNCDVYYITRCKIDEFSLLLGPYSKLLLDNGYFYKRDKLSKKCKDYGVVYLNNNNIVKIQFFNHHDHYDFEPPIYLPFYENNNRYLVFTKKENTGYYNPYYILTKSIDDIKYEFIVKEYEIFVCHYTKQKNGYDVEYLQYIPNATEYKVHRYMKFFIDTTKEKYTSITTYDYKWYDDFDVR